MDKEMAVALMGDRATVVMVSLLRHKKATISLREATGSNRAMEVMDRSHLGLVTRRRHRHHRHHMDKDQGPMDSKDPMVVVRGKDPMVVVVRPKEETAMDSKDLTVARDREEVAVVVAAAAAAAAAMEDGVKVKVVVRVGGMDVTKEIVQREVATEAEAVVVLTVVVLTAVVDMSAVDTTVAEEVDLLVWEVVTVVASKITVALETTAQGMNQLENRTTLTTTPFLSRDWEKMSQFRKSATSSSKLESSR